MATTVTNVSTLDITFHVDDGTTIGSTLKWKLNNPYNVTSLQQVKDAFGVDSQTYEDGLLALSGQGGQTGLDGFAIVDKLGNKIDGIDAAAVVEIVTTKNDLS